MPETTHAHLQERSRCPRTRLSNSFQVCLFGFKSGDMEAQGRRFNVVGEEMCSGACYMGSDIVVSKYSAIQRLMREIKLQNNMRFFF